MSGPLCALPSTEICSISKNLTLSSMNKTNTRCLKRKHESERRLRRGMPRHWNNNAWDVLDLVSLLNDLTLFDDRIEEISVKDVIRQEYIDRIGKLYKPVIMKQDGSENNSATTKMICNDEFYSIAKDDCLYPIFKNGLKEFQESQRVLIEYEIVSHFQDYVLKYFTEDLPYSLDSFEDRHLAITPLRHTFNYSENLYCSLLTYINSIIKKNSGNILFNDDSENDSECLHDTDTPKKKRRKVINL